MSHMIETVYIALNKLLVELGMLKAWPVRAQKELGTCHCKLEEKDPCCVVTEGLLAELCPVLCLKHNINYELGYLAEEIFKQSVEIMAWFLFFFLLLIAKCKRKKDN